MYNQEYFRKQFYEKFVNINVYKSCEMWAFQSLHRIIFLNNSVNSKTIANVFWINSNKILIFIVVIEKRRHWRNSNNPNARLWRTHRNLSRYPYKIDIPFKDASRKHSTPRSTGNRTVQKWIINFAIVISTPEKRVQSASTDRLVCVNLII